MTIADCTPRYNGWMRPTPPVLTADQALFARDAALNGMRFEHAVTRRVIDAIPIDKGDYRPDEIAKSALDLAWHIVAAEHRFLQAVATGTFDYGRSARPETITNSAEVSRWYADAFAPAVDQVAALPAELLTRPTDFRGLFTLPAVAFLSLGLNHSIHHRGQLSMYLRPMGAKVPAIYGESYDSAQASGAGA
jgi:uncharacterized damage-inducible protein DinB